MRDSDPFPRRTATPAMVAPWAVELVANLPGLLQSYGPGSKLDPRLRERINLAVTEINGCRYCAWIHGAWHEYLGDKGAAASEEALVGYARACAEAGHPVGTGPLEARLPADQVRAVRATVARIEMANLVGNTVDGLLARIAGKRPRNLRDALVEGAAIAAVLPVALPLLGLAAAMRVVTELAPPVPVVELPDAEPNLLAMMLAQAIPTYLAAAPVRLGVLGLPVPAGVAIKAGPMAATVRVGRGRVLVRNDVTGDALVVVEGEVDSLLQIATGHVLQGIAALRVRPPA